ERAIGEAGALFTQGRNDASIQRLELALGADPQNDQLRNALDSTRSEIARRQAEQERMERERLEYARRERERQDGERAEAEPRARKPAADQAIEKAWNL